MPAARTAATSSTSIGSSARMTRTTSGAAMSCEWGWAREVHHCSARLTSSVVIGWTSSIPVWASQRNDSPTTITSTPLLHLEATRHRPIAATRLWQGLSGPSTVTRPGESARSMSIGVPSSRWPSTTVVAVSSSPVGPDS